MSGLKSDLTTKIPKIFCLLDIGAISSTHFDNKIKQHWSLSNAQNHLENNNQKNKPLIKYTDINQTDGIYKLLSHNWMKIYRYQQLKRHTFTPIIQLKRYF